MADDPTLADLAESLLTSAAATLDDPPARQTVYWGLPSNVVVDCAQLVVLAFDVHQSRLISGFGAQIPRQPRQQPTIPVASFDVRLSLACWPMVDGNANPPSVTVISAAVRTALTQNFTLWRGITAEATDGTLFADVPQIGEGCLRAQVDAWAPTGPPAGGFVTGRFPVQVDALLMP